MHVDVSARYKQSHATSVAVYASQPRPALQYCRKRNLTSQQRNAVGGKKRLCDLQSNRWCHPNDNYPLEIAHSCFMSSLFVLRFYVLTHYKSQSGAGVVLCLICGASIFFAILSKDHNWALMQCCSIVNIHTQHILSFCVVSVCHMVLILCVEMLLKKKCSSPTR